MIKEWKSVSSKEGTRWLESVKEVLDKMKKEPRAYTPTSTAKLKKLTEWFLPQDEFRKKYPMTTTPRRINLSNNHETWGLKIAKAEEEFIKVAGGDVTLYRNKLYTRALKRLNVEIAKVGELEYKLYHTYGSELFPMTQTLMNQKSGPRILALEYNGS